MIDEARLRTYVFSQPSLSPDLSDITGESPPMCVNTPGAFRSNARLERWRDELAKRCAEDPDSQVWRRFLDAVIACLAWRETVPPEYRFWKQDAVKEWSTVHDTVRVE